MAKGRKAEFFFQNYLPDLMESMPQEIESRLLEAALLIEGEVKESLTGARSGKVYPVYEGSGTQYTASAPFEAPAWRTGELARKYQGFVKGHGLYAEGIVASPTIYSKWLEFGTRKMAMRPHLRKSAYKVIRDIEGEFEGLFE